MTLTAATDAVVLVEYRSPGDYRARICAWGRDLAASLYAEDPTPLIAGDRIVERYLIQFWR